MLKHRKSILSAFSFARKVCYVILLPLLCIACSDKTDTSWFYTNDGIAIWGNYPKGTAITWSGGSFCGVANGHGILTTTYPNGSSSQDKIKTHYEAISPDLIIDVDTKERYIGEIVDRKYSGFGVLLKGDDIYVGNFVSGKPDGQLSLFKNGKKYYQGNWKNGTFEGEGSLYKEDGSTRTGIWKSGTLVSAEVVIKTEVG